MIPIKDVEKALLASELLADSTLALAKWCAESDPYASTILSAEAKAVYRVLGEIKTTLGITEVSE